MMHASASPARVVRVPFETHLMIVEARSHARRARPVVFLGLLRYRIPRQQRRGRTRSRVEEYVVVPPTLGPSAIIE
jgi:hypothetical protein